MQVWTPPGQVTPVPPAATLKTKGQGRELRGGSCRALAWASVGSAGSRCPLAGVRPASRACLPAPGARGGCDGGPGRRQEKMSIQFTNVTAHLPTVFICQGCREASVRGGCLCDRSRCLLWQKFEGLCFLPQTRAAHSVRGLAGGLLSGQSRTVAEVLKHVAAGRMAQAQAVPSVGGGGKAPKAKQGP